MMLPWILKIKFLQYGPEITEESDEEVEVAPRITTTEVSESLQKDAVIS